MHRILYVPPRLEDNEVIFTRRLSGAKRALAILAAAMLVVPAIPVAAQDSDVELRIKKLEAEVRAVQRKVFPGGSDRFFEPEIEAQQPATQTRGSSANGAVSDLLARVDALEAQLAGLTAQIEENNFKLGQMETRLAAVEANAAAVVPITTPQDTAVSANKATDTVSAPISSGKPPAQNRVAQVAAIVKPSTGDAGGDEYLYGFRLWESKLYPEAQQQLKKTIETYPGHARNSHARNLLGRAYMDGGKLNLAAATLLANYQEKPQGERAPDSLYFLGVTMTKLKEKTKACAAFAELAEAYPAIASGRLARDIASGRSAASCK